MFLLIIDNPLVSFSMKNGYFLLILVLDLVNLILQLLNTKNLLAFHIPKTINIHCIKKGNLRSVITSLTKREGAFLAKGGAFLGGAPPLGRLSSDLNCHQFPGFLSSFLDYLIRSSNLSADNRIHAVIVKYSATVIFEDHFINAFNLPVSKISEKFA